MTTTTRDFDCCTEQAHTIAPHRGCRHTDGRHSLLATLDDGTLQCFACGATGRPQMRDRELESFTAALERCTAPGVLTERESARADQLRAIIADLAARRLPYSVTITERISRRVSAATAYNDHDVQLEPGTYRLTWHELKRLVATIPAIEEPWWHVTAGFAGVAYAGEQRGGDATSYYLDVDPYTVREGHSTRWPAAIVWNY